MALTQHDTPDTLRIRNSQSDLDVCQEGTGCANMLRVSNDPIAAGPALMQFLDAEWRALGTTQSAFARQYSIQNSLFSRWRKGGQPSAESIQTVALALGRPTQDLFMAAGMIPTPDGEEPRARPRTANVDVAIDADPVLSDSERDVLREVRTALRDMRSGELAGIYASEHYLLDHLDRRYRVIFTAGPAETFDYVQGSARWAEEQRDRNARARRDGVRQDDVALAAREVAEDDVEPRDPGYAE
jgi:transcriptional regulator with XRE-family HTH domain